MAWVLGVVKRMMERFVPPGGDADSQRRARLVVAYSLATVRAVLYSACYVALGLPLSALGAGIASLAFLAGPWLMRRSGSLALAANTVALAAGSGWSTNAAEGGIRSPAIGWFALVPWSAICWPAAWAASSGPC
ncbi:MAG: hypothetical protein U1F43_35670 [Myxococcota bacterium]